MILDAPRFALGQFRAQGNDLKLKRLGRLVERFKPNAALGEGISDRVLWWRLVEARWRRFCGSASPSKRTFCYKYCFAVFRNLVTACFCLLFFLALRSLEKPVVDKNYLAVRC